MRMTTRKRLFIDRQVQGALLFRTVVYWFFLLVATSLIMLGVYAIREPGGTFFEYCRLVLARHGILAIATLLLLPLVIYDVLVTTNRFAGPVYRMRRAMRSLAADEPIGPLQFREGDYWRGLADEFNAVAARMAELKRQADGADPDHAPRDLQPIGWE